jgi:hypothetical protein
MMTRLFLPLSLAALAAGCSVLINVDGKQCATDLDCAPFRSSAAALACRQSVCVDITAELGAAGAGGRSGAPNDDPLVCKAREASTAPTVKYSFAPIFAQAPTEPKPFSIKACQQLDLICEHPVFGPIDVNAGEPQDFEVAPGFNGYFEITNPDTLGGLLFMGRPVVVDTIGWNVTMPTPEVVAQLAFATGEQVDPELGLILSVAGGGDPRALAGVTFMNTKGGLGYYFVNSLPDTGLSKTGPQGAAGYANVPITTAILSGIHASGKALGPVSVRVKPHWISFAEIFP